MLKSLFMLYLKVNAAFLAVYFVASTIWGSGPYLDAGAGVAIITGGALFSVVLGMALADIR